MNNQNQQPNIVPEQPPVEPAKKPKPKWLVPVIVVVGVIVLALLVWGGYELFKPGPPEEPVVGDELGDWKVYKNEGYGIEFKYPDNWSFVDIPSSTQWEKLYIGFGPSDSLAEAYYAISMMIINRSYAQQLEQSRTFYFGIDSEFKEKELVVDKIKGTRFEFESCAMTCEPGLEIVFPLKNYTLSFGLRDLEPGPEKTEEILNQILSTFKFLEPDGTANWKTYRNEEYGFEVKYPEELILVSEDSSFEIKRSQGDDQPRFVITINPESWLFKPYLNRVSESGLDIDGHQFTKTNFEADSDPTLGCGEKGIKGFNLNLASIEERQKKDIRLWASACKNDSEILDTFNQILSTFKFLD